MLISLMNNKKEITRFCLLTVLIAFTLLLHGCTKSPPKQRSVLFLMLDTLRADHLSSYGYGRETSPNLDKFAKDNIRYEYAISAAPWTPASVATMFTGMYPITHGMMPPNSREQARSSSSKLGTDLDVLAEVFKRYGYKTAGVSSNPWISEEFGFTQGFDDFVFEDRARADRITELGEKKLEELSKGESPFFLYLHYIDPHDPYDPPGEYKTMFEGDLGNKTFKYSPKSSKQIGRYDGEIRFMDHQLGRLFESLKAKGLYEDLIIVIVGDHGEQFMERGHHGHGFKLYNEEVHVPMMLRTGNWRDKGRLVSSTVSTIDIYPTLLTLNGIQVAPSFMGIPLTDKTSLGKRSGVLSEIYRRYQQKAIVGTDRKKLILELDLEKGDFNLEKHLHNWANPKVVGAYDATQDPEELNPLKDSHSFSRLRADFDSVFKSAASKRLTSSSGKETEVSDETLDKLKSLGYLQ